jgi:hypothetical protein
MGMRCSWVRRRLVRYAEGALAPVEASRVREHLMACPGCAGELRLAKGAGRILRSGAPQAHEPAGDLWRRVAVRLPAGRVRRARPALTWALAGSVLVLLAFVTLAGPTIIGKSHQPVVVKAPSAPVVTPPAAIKAHSEDEAAARLNGWRHPDETPVVVPTEKPAKQERPAISGARISHPAGKAATGAAVVRRTTGPREAAFVIPFATEADRRAHGLKDQPRWSREDRDPDQAVRDEASVLFSY